MIEGKGLGSCQRKQYPVNVGNVRKPVYTILRFLKFPLNGKQAAVIGVMEENKNNRCLISRQWFLSILCWVFSWC